MSTISSSEFWTFLFEWTLIIQSALTFPISDQSSKTSDHWDPKLGMPSLYGQVGNKKIQLEYSRPEYSRLEYSRLEYSRLEYSRPERARKRAHLTLFLALFGSIWLSLAPIHETSSCCLWTGMGKAPSTMSLLLKVFFLPFKVVDATLEGMPPKRGAYCYAFFFFWQSIFFGTPSSISTQNSNRVTDD